MGQTVVEVSNTVFPNTDRPRPANNLFIFFFHGIAVKGPEISKILFRIKKFTFAMIALVIRVNSSLTLSKVLTFYVVYDTFKAVTKGLKSC